MKQLLLAFWLLGLAACSTTPVTKENPLWQFTGKFSLRSAELNQTGYIEWQQFEQSYAIRLWGALGIGTTIITGDAERITIDNGKQRQTIDASEAAQLFPNIRIPLAAVANNSSLLRNGETGTSQLIPDTDNWHIDYQKAKIFDAIERPSKLKLSNNTIALTLLIKEWG